VSLGQTFLRSLTDDLPLASGNRGHHVRHQLTCRGGGVDAICRQHSVTFTEADLLRQKQVFEYKSDEWEEFYGDARQAIEGLHSIFKNEGKEHVYAAQRSKVRGFAAAQVLTTILLANFNLRTIASFHFEEQHETEPAGPRLQNRRDRLFYNPYTKTNPEVSILELQR